MPQYLYSLQSLSMTNPSFLHCKLQGHMVTAGIIRDACSFYKQQTTVWDITVLITFWKTL